jgi:hypothetical protein
MSRILVGWAPYLETDYQKGLAFFAEKPISLYDTHIKSGNHKYKLCPANKDLTRNTFVVRSPFNAHFIVDADKRTIEFVQPNVQPFDFFHMRAGEYSDTDQPIMSINYHQIFVTENKDVEMTMTAPWFEETHHDFRVIPGRFKISDWWRPVDFAIQLKQRRQEIVIKRGDPLFYLTFVTKDPTDIVKIKEVKLTEGLKDILASATGAKHYQARCPLKTLYGVFSKYKRKPTLEFLE